MEGHSLFAETRQFIALIGCNECDGEAHVIRRAPYPFEGLEFRTFECSECGNQMERVATEPRPITPCASRDDVSSLKPGDPE